MWEFDTPSIRKGLILQGRLGHHSFSWREISFWVNCSSLVNIGTVAKLYKDRAVCCNTTQENTNSHEETTPELVQLICIWFMGNYLVLRFFAGHFIWQN